MTNTLGCSPKKADKNPVIFSAGSRAEPSASSSAILEQTSKLTRHGVVEEEQNEERVRVRDAREEQDIMPISDRALFLKSRTNPR